MAHELASQGVADLAADIHPVDVASQQVATHLSPHPAEVVTDGETRCQDF